MCVTETTETSRRSATGALLYVLGTHSSDDLAIVTPNKTIRSYHKNTCVLGEHFGFTPVLVVAVLDLMSLDASSSRNGYANNTKGFLPCLILRLAQLA